MGVEIRDVRTLEEFRACEALQQRVWEMADGLDVVPLHLLVSAQRNGGLVLGAFDGDALIGFVFGYPGLTPQGRLKHTSHMMGIAPGHQGQGVGFCLKRAQRERALAQGCDLMTWTYDPLESRNANLNIQKLGAVCRTYIRDFYGPMEDGLNRGIPSDRFQVEWWISSRRVEQRMASPSYRTATGSRQLLEMSAFLPMAPRTDEQGNLVPGSLCLQAEEPNIRVEIPPEYRKIRAADPELALKWRYATREVFEFYFAQGYAVTDYAIVGSEGGRRGFYLLTREDVV